MKGQGARIIYKVLRDSRVLQISFQYSRSPLHVESPPICVDDFQYIAEGTEGMQMLEFMFKRKLTAVWQI